jgi:thiol:disulfide interchange protein
MRNYIFLLLCYLNFIFSISAQESIISWKTEVLKESESEYSLIFKAELKNGWHLYSQHIGEGGPLATTFNFTNKDIDFKLIGSTEESKTQTSYEEIFEMETSYFEKKAIFKQRIKLLKANVSFINVSASYQTCDDEACTFEPDQTLQFTLIENTPIAGIKNIDKKSITLAKTLDLKISNKSEFLKNLKGNSSKKKGLSSIFLLGVFGGLIALLTPCVFPMIPLTVSFFTKKSGTRKNGVSSALLYGFFIVFIYLLLSLPFHFLDSLAPEILNSISTNVWLNLSFFIIFIIFALSFLGYFDISLPHSWSDKMDSASDIGGIIGIFFMALTLAIVSFSCTGPILGSLLVGTLSSDGGALQLTFGMVGFGSALALPFTLFALFPNWLTTLPKSGGWLNTVKVILGFLEIALALKFLSNADMVQHWGLLKREVFIVIWILIFSGLTLYVFGKIKFPHDGPLKKISIGRKITGITSGLFTVYLISGLLCNTSLSLLSGFAPPKFYSIQKTTTNCPLDLNCFKDFERGVLYAKQVNKPILLDFTGWACVNCRKMEENVWSNPKVYAELEKFVLISLYVDDRQQLPEGTQFDFKKPNGKVKTIKTIGSKWATLQSINFATASQPFYVQLSTDMKLLNYPEKYTDTQTYLKWLQDGLNNLKTK